MNKVYLCKTLLYVLASPVLVVVVSFSVLSLSRVSYMASGKSDAAYQTSGVVRFFGPAFKYGIIIGLFLWVGTMLVTSIVVIVLKATGRF